MAQEFLRLPISFQTLINALAQLDTTEKRQLWRWLESQMSIASLRERQTDYSFPQLETQHQEILQKLKMLPPSQRLAIVEATLQTLHEELEQGETPSYRAEQKKQLTLAAEALLADYNHDRELTIFTMLDSENFHE